jgi:hypothetical protein
MAIAAGDKPNPDMMAALQSIVSAGGTTGSTGRVYMGQYTVKRPAGASNQAWKNIQEIEGRVKGSNRDIWLNQQQAEQEYYHWNPKQQADFVAKGILSGLLKLGDGPMEGAALWKKLVKEAANYGAAGQKVSPIDLMASYVQASGGANAWRQAGVWEINTQTGERRYVGPGVYLGSGRAQQTDTRVDLTDPDTARAISTKLFQELMGRDPGEGELSAFASALHTAEQNNPVVSTTTTQYDMETGQPVGSESTQSGGLTSEARAYIQEQQIKKNKEYGVTQAVTTYQGAFENLVFGSPE